VIRRLLVLCAVFSITATAALADPTPTSKVAPADEYFGRLKMSVLGVSNVIKDMRLRVEADAEKTPSIFGSLAFVEDALRDWERKYPHDTWIPKNLYALELTYLKGSGEKARMMAMKTEAWLHRDYPKTMYAVEAHRALATAPVTTTMTTTATAPIVIPAGSIVNPGDAATHP
jgi:hypothetical protein